MRDIKTEFLAASFGYLAKNGLETMSIRNLCKNTGISIGSVYYWFEGKEDLIASAAEYGLGVVLNDILTYAVDKTDNLDYCFDNFVDGVDKYSERIKFICQVVSSPLYGEKLRCKTSEHMHLYENYASVLSEKIGAPYEDVRAIVFLMASVVLDYSVWANKEVVKLQLDFIKKTVNAISNK